MDRVWPGDVYHAEIHWREPMDYESALSLPYEDQEESYFYKILGGHGQSFSLFYIGKTFRQSVTVRLKNKDHQGNRLKWESEHSKHRLLVSLGDLRSKHFNDASTKVQAKIVDDLESMLIYSHSYHLKFKNRQNIGSHQIGFEYHLINSGFLKDKMLSEITYGMFYKY